MKFVCYYRVSTARQGKSGLGLEAQKEAVRVYLNGISRRRTVEEVVEVESGKRSDRPELARALALCRLHKAILIIAKLDRLARNVHFISGLLESDVEFVAVDFPQATKLTIHILAAMAEHEAVLISERTKAALRRARERGVALGGHRGNLDRTTALLGAKASALVRKADAHKRRADVLPVIRELQGEGAASLRAVAARLNSAGVPAPRGGQWYGATVRRTLAA